MLCRNLYRVRRLSMMILIGGSKVANSLQQFTLYSKSIIPLYLGPWTCVCDANNANPQIMHLSAHSSPTQMRQHGRSVAGTMHGQVQTYLTSLTSPDAAVGDTGRWHRMPRVQLQGKRCDIRRSTGKCDFTCDGDPF